MAQTAENKMQTIATGNIEVLRARAQRYRRLANELFDRRTSEEAARLARELDEEVARLETGGVDVEAEAAVELGCHEAARCAVPA